VRPSDLVIEGLAVRPEGHRNGTVNTIDMLGTRDRLLVILATRPIPTTIRPAPR
jgi:hypothetical protein